MRFDPDFSPGGPQTVPIDRAVTLLMPTGFDAEYGRSEPSAADHSLTTAPERRPDRAPSLRERLVGFLLRPN